MTVTERNKSLLVCQPLPLTMGMDRDMQGAKETKTSLLGVSRQHQDNIPIKLLQKGSLKSGNQRGI